MTRLPDETYLDHIRNESRRFREALAKIDSTTRVPSCPEWEAADLAWHLAEVHAFWTWVITHRPTTPDDFAEPERPTSYDDVLGALEQRTTALVAALEAADPKETAWTWSSEQSVGFTLRRQAHEALIHRLDAELTAGEVTELDARLAADGVEEALDVMFGGTPEWGSFAGDDRFVRVDCIDTDDHTWVQLGRFTGTDPDGGQSHEEDINVVGDPGREPDAVVSGTAADLDAWLWRRADDAGITVTGDQGVLESFRGCVDHPIN